MGRLVLTIMFALILGTTTQSAFAQGGNDTRGISDIQQTDDGQIGARRALVIGISKYKNIRQLQYADSDAIMVHDYLVNDPATGMTENDITMLLDSMATRGRIFTELKKIIDISKANDQVIIYFAGHGDVETDLEVGFLLGYDCEKSNYPATDAVDISMLERYLNALARNQVKVIMIVDACRAGNLAGGRAGAQTTMTSLNDRFNNIAKILSCKPGELSEEKEFSDGGHGVFTYYLVSGLSGMADENNDGIVDQDELESYLREEVKNETEKRQHPKIDGTMHSFKVDENTKKMVADRMKKGTGTAPNTGQMVASRGIGDEFIAKLDSNSKSLLDKFKQHIKDNKFNGSSTDNAYGDYLAAVKQNKNREMLQYMRYELEAELEDATQEWLNYYLRGELEKYTSWKFESYDDAADKLDIVLSLMDKNDFRYSTIEANKYFFKSIPVYVSNNKAEFPKGIEYLNKADSLNPNQPHILSVLGMFYGALKEPNYAKAEEYYMKSIKLSPKWVYPYVSLGVVYYERKEYEKAIEYYQKALAIDKKNANANYNIGLVYMNQPKKDIEKGMDYYREAIKCDSTFYNPYMTIGHEYLQEKRLLLAKYYLAKSVLLAGNKPAPFNEMGTYYYSLQEYDSASLFYDAAIELDSTYSTSYFNKALVLVAQKKNDEAKLNYKKAIEYDPKGIDAYLNLGSIEQDEKNYDKALKIYQQALALDTNYASTYNSLGILYRRQKMNDKALQYYAICIKKDSTNSDGYNNSANIYNEQGKYDKAIEYYQKAIKLDSTSSRYYNNIGLVYYALKDYQNAGKSYLTAIERDTFSPDPYLNYGLVLNKLKKYDEALVYYQKALRHEGDDSAVCYYDMGLAYVNLKQPEKGIEMFNTALKINPKYASAMLRLGVTEHDAGHYDKAMDYYQKTLALDSTTREVWYNMALIYKGVDAYKDYDKAVTYFEKAAKVDTSYKLPYVRIGDIYKAQKDYAKAKKYYEKALNSTDYAGDGYYGLGQISDLQEDFKSSLKYYKKSVEADSTNTDNLYGYAYTARRQGDTLAALATNKKILEIDPTYNSALQEIANIYVDKSNLDSAFIYYQRMVDLDSTNDLAWVMMGYIYSANSKNDSALYCYHKAIEINPQYSFASLNIGYILEGQKKYKEAQPYFIKVIQYDSTNYEAMMALGVNYQYLKDFDKALLYLLKTTELKPDLAVAYYNLACWYSLQHQPEKSLENLELSFQKGYFDVEHMKVDTDLDNIRDLQAYKDLIAKYSKK